MVAATIRKMHAPNQLAAVLEVSGSLYKFVAFKNLIGNPVIR